MSTARPLRVLFLHQLFPSNRDEGSGRAYDFAKQLVRDGHTVTIVAGQFSHLTGQVAPEHRGRLFAREQHAEGWTVLRCWSASGYHDSYFRRALAFAAYMATSFVVTVFGPPCDILIASCPPVTVGMVGGLAARLKRARFIYEVRDLWLQGAAELGIVKNRALLAFVRWWERALFRQASAVVINSPGFTPYLVAHGVAQEKIILVPNGVDTAEFRPDADGSAVRARLGLEGKFVAVYAGSLGLANDLPTIVRAAELLRDEPEFRILLVGDGNRRRQAEAEARAKGLANIIFTGAIPKQEVAQYLCAADVGLCTLLDTPLFRTVYPNKVFDAMACGRPVVILVDGVIREVVEGAQAGVFVPPGDAAGLANALRRLRAGPAEERRQMGLRGRALVEERFDRWRSARLMSQVVSDVAQR